MTTFAFPSTVLPSQISWGFNSNTGMFGPNPLNNAFQTRGRPGSMWVATLQFTNLTAAKRAALQAFLVKLNGQEHRFLLSDKSNPRRGSGGGTPLVAGALQTGTSLNTDGWTASTSGVLLEGDNFAVGGELKKCTQDVNSDGAGAATIEFQPQIRFAPVDNSAVDIDDPVGTFMLADPNVSWSTVPGNISTFSFQAMEDVLS